MERKLVISRRMMHNLIQNVVKSYEQFHSLTTADGQMDSHSDYSAHLWLVQYCLRSSTHCFTGTDESE